MDTVKLKIPYHRPSPDSYFFKAESIKRGGARYWTNNHFRKLRQKQGFYVPKYSIEEDYLRKNIHFCFEASLPKLIYGESLSEIKDSDFPVVINSILSFLKKIRITDISSHQIENITPTVFAIAKNISLETKFSTNFALKALSPFDYRANSIERKVDFNKYKAQGKEIIFSVGKYETIKFYDKVKEILNNVEDGKATRETKQLAKRFSDKSLVLEILRFEQTFKNTRKVKLKFGKYLEAKDITFKNIFRKGIQEKIMKEEIEKIYSSPYEPFLFLAQEQKPFVTKYLNKYHSHITLKNNVWGIINSLQEYGLAETRERYIKQMCKQTWYNYESRLKKMAQQMDFSEIQNLDSFKIFVYVLKQFGIERKEQGLIFY